MTLYLIAHIRGHCVAFDTATIESVVDIGTIVPTPGADPTVLGLAALRSRVVTVIDSGAALGLPADALAACRAVVAVVEGHYYAFIVNSLEDVADHAARPLTAGMSLDEGWARAAAAYLERGDEAVLIVDIAALVPVARGATASAPARRAA